MGVLAIAFGICVLTLVHELLRDYLVHYAPGYLPRHARHQQSNWLLFAPMLMWIALIGIFV